MEKLRVLLAEDYDVTRTLVAALLSKDFNVVDAVSDGEELIQAAVLFGPDVIVSDIAMSLVDGFLTREELLSRGIQIPFVFITVLDTSKFDFLLDKYPIAYVHKLDIPRELKAAVEAVASGSRYLSRSFQKDDEGRH